MNSEQNTKSRTISTNNFMTTALLAVFFAAVSMGQAEAQIAHAPTNVGWERSINHAIDQSESSGKPIMLVFSGSDWCSYCQRLEHEVLQTPEFKTWSSNNVIKVMVDFPQYYNLSADVARQNQRLKQYFEKHLRGYPTVLMITSDGSIIGRTGYVAGGPMAWISKADSIIQKPEHHLADKSSRRNNSTK